MQKFKSLLIKYWIIGLLIGGLGAGFALVKLPNLSNLAIQSTMPKDKLTNRAQQITRHWQPNLNDATPLSITYSVPTEFSNSQKLRLENKERFLIEHKADLKIYKVTSRHTSPHAQKCFHGKNWYKLELWVPQKLVNVPIYQAQLRHLCALPGIKTNWQNPLNEHYQTLSTQWYQQKISCSWLLVISFLLLLFITSLTTALLITLANLELSIIVLSLITNLSHHCYFYLPFLIILASCLISLSFVLFYQSPRWLTKLPHPMQAWHPLISLFLLSCLIFPLISNCHLYFQNPSRPQTVTVYLTSSKSIINQKNLADLDHLTKALQALPNVKQVTSLTQPGGKSISKYQLGTQLAEINQNLAHRDQITQTTAEQLKQLGDKQIIPKLLQNQTDQLHQLQTETEPKETLTKLLQNQFTTQTELTKQVHQSQQQLAEAQTRITENNPRAELQALSNFQRQTNHLFYLTSQDAHDSDFNQTCFNYNNQAHTATRLAITLRNGKLGTITKFIKAQLVGTDFQSAIGMSGIPVLAATQQSQFHSRLPYFIIGLISLFLLINWIKFKSFGLALTLLLLVIIATSASLGLLAYLTHYEFTPNLGYLMLLLITLLSLLPNSKNSMLLTLMITLPFLLVLPFRNLGLALLTFALIYHSFLPVILKINQQKNPLLISCFQKYLKNHQR